MEWNSATQHKVSSILLDRLHPFHSEFQLRGSGRRYAVLMFRTRDSFLPKQNGWEGQTSSLAVWALQAAVAGLGAHGVYETDVFSSPSCTYSFYVSVWAISVWWPPLGDQLSRQLWSHQLTSSNLLFGAPPSSLSSSYFLFKYDSASSSLMLMFHMPFLLPFTGSSASYELVPTSSTTTSVCSLGGFFFCCCPAKWGLTSKKITLSSPSAKTTSVKSHLLYLS